MCRHLVSYGGGTFVHLLAPGSDTVCSLLSGLCFIIPPHIISGFHVIYTVQTLMKQQHHFCDNHVFFSRQGTSLNDVFTQHVIDCTKGGFPLERHIYNDLLREVRNRRAIQNCQVPRAYEDLK